MNNRGANPNLTWIVIGLAVFIAVIALAASAYNGFTAENNIYQWNSSTRALDNISSMVTDQNGLNGINTALRQNQFSLVKNAIGGIASSLNAFMIGFGAISLLLQMPQLVQTTFDVITSVIGVPSALLWLISFVITFYIIMKIIQAYRGTISAP